MRKNLPCAKRTYALSSRMNGSQTSVMICAAGNMVLYQGSPKKGDESVAGSPLEFYDGILVSDHEAALIKHGSQNQGCMAHIKRYIINSIENEKSFTWNAMMKERIRDMMTLTMQNPAVSICEVFLYRLGREL